MEPSVRSVEGLVRAMLFRAKSSVSWVFRFVFFTGSSTKMPFLH